MVRARMVIQRGSYDDEASESEEEGNGVANDSDASSDPALPSGKNHSFLLALIGFSFRPKFLQRAQLKLNCNNLKVTFLETKIIKYSALKWLLNQWSLNQAFLFHTTW